MNLHNPLPHRVARSAPLLAVLFSLGFVTLPGQNLDNPPLCCSCITGPTMVSQIDTSDGTTILMESQPLDSMECLKGRIDQNGKVKLEFTVPNNCASGSKPRVRLSKGGLGSAEEQAVDTNGVATFVLDGWSTDTELIVQILCAQEDSVCEKGCIRLGGCDNSCSNGCDRGSSAFGGNVSDDGQEGLFSGSIGIGTGNNGELSTGLEFKIAADRNLGLSDLKVTSGGAYIKTSLDPNAFSMETGTAFVMVDQNPDTGTLTLDYYFDVVPSEKFRTITIENVTVVGVDNAIKVGVTDVLNATTRYFEFHYRDSAKQWDYLSGSANGTDWMRRTIVTRGTATASERNEQVKVVEQAMGQTGTPDPASDDTVSDIERTYELFGTAWRMTHETIDPDGDALVSEWTYWLNGETTGPASSAGVGRLRWHGRYDGYEEDWNYAENWQSVSRTWRSAMLAETVETSWDTDNKTSTVTTTRNNYNAGLVTRTYDYANRTVTESRAIDSTLTTGKVTTYRDTGADFGGRVDKVVHFDDTLTTYGYDRTGGVMTLTTETGAGTTSVTEGEQTEMKYDALGELQSLKVTAISTGAGIVLQHMKVTDTDALGRPTVKSYFPDGPGGSAYTETMSYSCCGLGTETDRYGEPTSHTYDLLGRRTSSTRLSVTTETIHDGLTTKQHRYPALVSASASDTNEIARTVRNVSDTEIDHYAPSPQTGNLVLMEEERTTWLNPLGTPNSLDNTGGRKVVRTRIQVVDDGLQTPSQTTWYNRDGTFYETTGNLETKRREHWAQYNGRLYHYLYHKNAAGTSYLVTLTGYDNLGSVSYVNDKMRLTSYVKNTKNQVIRSYGDGGTGNVIVDNYEYNDKGDRVVTSRSLSSATSINYGADPITATLTYPDMRGSTPVIRTETRVWEPGDSTSYSGGGGTVASYFDRTPDGRESWTEVFPTTIVATEHGGNGSKKGYGLTHTETTLPGGGNWTVFETRADGTKFKQFHVAGRLDYAALEDDTGTTIEATYLLNPKLTPFVIPKL